LFFETALNTVVYDFAAKSTNPTKTASEKVHLAFQPLSVTSLKGVVTRPTNNRSCFVPKSFTSSYAVSCNCT